MDRPYFVKDEHLRFLDELRRSGVCNMFEGPKALQIIYDDELDWEQCKSAFRYWAATFKER